MVVSPTPPARRVEFEELPRVVQDRFVGAASGTFPPFPILSAHARAPASRGWAVLGVAAAVVLTLIATDGFGDPYAPHATQSRWTMVAWMLLIATIALAVLRAVRGRGARDLPFPAGVYVFPSSVIDARSPTLRIESLAAVSLVFATEHVVTLKFIDGEVFRFEVEDARAARDAVEQLQHALVMHRSHEPHALELADPLFVPEEGFPIATSAPLRVRWPMWVERSLGFAAITGVVLGGAGFLVRDDASDKLAFERAQRSGTPALIAYTEHGRRYRESARQMIATDARAARRAALLHQLTQITTVEGVREFATTHRTEAFYTAIDERLRAINAKARANVPNSPASLVLADPLSCGTRLRVQVFRGTPELREANWMVGQSPRYAGQASLPSRYFQPAHAPVHDAITKSIESSFPEGCLRVSSETDDGPRVMVVWTPRFLGRIYETKNPPAVFAAFAIDVEARVFAADGTELAKRTTTLPTKIPDSALKKFERMVLRPARYDAIEVAAYGALADDAMKRLGRDVAAWLVESNKS